MTASAAAVFAEHRETRREGEEKEDAPHSNTTTTTAARDERRRRERRRPSGLGAPSPFVFADVFETSSRSDDDDVNDENTTERHKRRLAAFRTKELERRKRIKEIGVERRRHTGGGVAFDDA